jgi:DNA polymerase-1
MATRLAPVSETTKPAPIPSTTQTLQDIPVFSPDAPSVSATEAPVVPLTEQPRLLVLDGHSMAFRAFFALPADKFSTARGQHTNAIHGFTSMLINLIKEQKPTHVAVAFDVSDETTHRKAEYSDYKGGRNETPREMSGQIDLIDQVMGAWGIKTIKMPGYEADDILATLAAMGEKAGYEVLLVSGDRDAFQLITDNVFVLYPKKGVSDIPRMDAAAVEDKYFVSPSRYSDLAALVGRDRGQPARRPRRRTQDGSQVDQPLRRPRRRAGTPRCHRRKGGGLAARQRGRRQAQPQAEPAPHRP